ncbi:interleukin-2 receptor subunit beta [Silurus meridionalis]|nr:interleukin-2 receptor subunit beta [Silurus meridionalis]XP_046706918.1 interleukin-2 receptor subunit beta [Silurus meridionalis]XP_046706920.1 interleukin-2 receptor subunit beta [Silurus meridionalis]XP_046706921.1 interleukin-2 receptor subunit beta [Silurus meridionalis]XP_046706930.1 interleukin-2 receptor subunit beta [Silurus meridionalis]XP_046706939.1 interleukin-2 receptor subunit beta [Silurus meridionalis]XP_046706948.1 interleukin-2 receptor subunit beta [Silurus meridionali
MKRKMLIGKILMLMMSLISSGSNNLECYTDGMDVITCIWNTSSVEDRFQIKPTTNCSLKSIYSEYVKYQTPQSKMEPLGSSQPKLRKGTVNFEKNSLPRGSPTLELFVYCENITEPVETIPNFYPPNSVRVYPPKRPHVEGANVTWQPGTPQSKLVFNLMYEVQWGLLENSWEVNKVASTEFKYCELPEQDLIKGRNYVVRVRSVSVQSDKNPLFWSEWSPVTQWTATVGKQPSTDPIYIMPEVLTNVTSIVILAAVAVLLFSFFYILKYRRIMKCPYVPTPGKYFTDLFSEHGGDFRSWLGPIVNPEMYIKAESECVAPVTLYKACNSDIFSKKMEKDVSMTDGNTSSFSNSTYFLTKISKGAVVDQLEPCSTDCPYGPTGGGSVQEKILPPTHDNCPDSELSEVSMSSPLETSSSYKQLQKLRLDIQSPDSGFAGSSEEQESQEESGSEGLPSPPVVDNTLPISCFLPCPVPQMKRPTQMGIPFGLEWNPWNNSNFVNLHSNFSSNILIGNSGIIAGSGILEPSSDDYMPVKKV